MNNQNQEHPASRVAAAVCWALVATAVVLLLTALVVLVPQM